MWESNFLREVADTFQTKFGLLQSWFIDKPPLEISSKLRVIAINFEDGKHEVNSLKARIEDQITLIHELRQEIRLLRNKNELHKELTNTKDEVRYLRKQRDDLRNQLNELKAIIKSWQGSKSK